MNAVQFAGTGHSKQVTKLFHACFFFFLLCKLNDVFKDSLLRVYILRAQGTTSSCDMFYTGFRATNEIM